MRLSESFPAKCENEKMEVRMVTTKNLLRFEGRIYLNSLENVWPEDLLKE